MVLFVLQQIPNKAAVAPRHRHLRVITDTRSGPHGVVDAHQREPSRQVRATDRTSKALARPQKSITDTIAGTIVGTLIVVTAMVQVGS